MKVEWEEDKEYIDCWDLVRNGQVIAYTMRPRCSGTLVWVRDQSSPVKAPSQDVEEAKVIIQAMVLLGG